MAVGIIAVALAAIGWGVISHEQGAGNVGMTVSSVTPFSNVTSNNSAAVPPAAGGTSDGCPANCTPENCTNPNCSDPNCNPAAGAGNNTTGGNATYTPGTNVTGGPAAGREWLVANVTIDNNRSYDIPVSWDNFRLEAGGQNYSPVSSLQGNYSPPANVPSHQSKQMDVVFDVPAGANPSQLHFDDVIARASAPTP